MLVRAEGLRFSMSQDKNICYTDEVGVQAGGMYFIPAETYKIQSGGIRYEAIRRSEEDV